MLSLDAARAVLRAKLADAAVVDAEQRAAESELREAEREYQEDQERAAARARGAARLEERYPWRPAAVAAFTERTGDWVRTMGRLQQPVQHKLNAARAYQARREEIDRTFAEIRATPSPITFGAPEWGSRVEFHRVGGAE